MVVVSEKLSVNIWAIWNGGASISRYAVAANVGGCELVISMRIMALLRLWAA